MRLLILLLIPALSFAAPKRPTPTPTPTPKIVVKQDMVCRTKQQDLELRDWINGLMDQLHLAQADNEAAKKTNAETVTTLGMSVKDAKAVIDECAADKACAKSPFTCGFKRLLHHILWIAGAIVVLLVILIVILIVINILTGGALTGFFSIFGTIGKWIAALLPKPKPPTPPVQPPKI